MGISMFGTSIQEFSTSPTRKRRDKTHPYTDDKEYPYKCSTKWTKKNNGYIMAMFVYEHADNFDGKKLLVYDDVERFNSEIFSKLTDVDCKREGVDPHFLEGDTTLSPVARFEPTSKGIYMAKKFIMA